MAEDLFISYAWTSDQHRQWVRLLASQLKALGYGVLVDADVDYGDGLTGFMRRVVDSRHVLMIADENYVNRADNIPESGVGIENRWLAEAHEDRPTTWLTVLFKDNPNYLLPQWLSAHKPKGHSFNANSHAGDFPGSEQIEELWRWVEGLPTSRDSATSIPTLRERAARLERHTLRSDQTRWRNPSLSGEVHFPYEDAPSNTYRWGYGEFEFAIDISPCGSDSVYVYRDPMGAVGIIRPDHAPVSDLASHLSPGRFVVAKVGETIVLMNAHGALSLVEIVGVQHQISGPPYVSPYLDFRYDVVNHS
ncbi:TIR domain-containing protein [Kocuria flava]|uniref:TIR domain-containing protein n=1 Tax=Kocuria flava TaxID=446860 RepID=UPI0015DED663|nr:TIR domain-containing protein [Kocuria flava]